MKIIFCCTGNTCRSPMAEYLLKKLLQEEKIDNVEVESRGIMCSNGCPISQNSLICLQEVGIDASLHKSQSITIKDLIESDLIVTMTKSHKDFLVSEFNAGENVKTFEEVAGIKDIIDPYGASLQYYRQCRDEINVGIKKIFDNLKLNKQND